MQCPTCGNESRRFGRNRNGGQRWQCLACNQTFTDGESRPADRRRIEQERAVMILRMLLEGNSVRSTERLTGTHRDTILDLMVENGIRCQRWMERTIQNVPVSDVQVDEIWAYVKCKQKTADRLGRGPEVGDAWCFTAMERHTKLMLAWYLGKRTPESAVFLADGLRRATAGRFQLTTDGLRHYLVAIPTIFESGIDYAQLVKQYGDTPEEGRYSPGTVIGIIKHEIIGNPDRDRICTSHVERHNKTIRMQIRRFTRLTDGHSKKWENHEAAIALFFAFYNFCRVHSTLKQTPAMEAGLTDHVWSVRQLLEAAARQ